MIATDATLEICTFLNRVKMLTELIFTSVEKSKKDVLAALHLFSFVIGPIVRTLKLYPSLIG